MRSQLADLRAAFEDSSDEEIGLPADAPAPQPVVEALPDFASTVVNPAFTQIAPISAAVASWKTTSEHGWQATGYETRSVALNVAAQSAQPASDTPKSTPVTSVANQEVAPDKSECELGYLSLYAEEANPLTSTNAKTAGTGRGEAPPRVAIAVQDVTPEPKPALRGVNSIDRTRESRRTTLVEVVELQPTMQVIEDDEELSPLLDHEDDRQESEPAHDVAHVDASDLVSAEVIPFVRAQVRFAAEYELPSVELLTVPPQSEGPILTEDILEETAGKLEKVIRDFGVKGEVIHVHAGPVVTLYEFEPAPGIKTARVIALAEDIARSMSAVSARVAVIPGRNAIGIELPNEVRETVYLREQLTTEDFGISKQKLPLCLGKTIGGEPVIADLARMPHLLVAGTTGSGKSVAINTMILSLLYRFKPQECRLIMVDPKMLELSVYDGIPHLLTPVVTDPKKAIIALRWAVREMEDRYKKMSKLGVRNIDGFNARVTEASARGEVITRTVQSGFDKETGEASLRRRDHGSQSDPLHRRHCR